MTPLKYTIGAILALPLLPVMYIQGRKIKAAMPDLPEATGAEGICGSSTNKTIQMLVMGESTMAGVGVETHEEGFAGTLAKELADCFACSIHWKVHAKSGLTAARVNQEILPSIQETDWDLIVIGLGGNDAFKLNHPRKWKREVREVINDIRKRFGDVPIVFTNMPPIKEFPAFTTLMKFTLGNLVELLGEALNEIAEEMDNVYYASDAIVVKKWVEKFNLSADMSHYFSDGVHPSKLTYQILAKQSAEFIGQKVDI